MIKHRTASLLMSSPFSRLAELYQRLLSGAATYEGFATFILGQIKHAYAFRRVERVRQLSNALINIPIREYQLIGLHYLAWCQCREHNFQDEILETIIEQTQTYKSKALISRAALDVYRGNFEGALHFYNESIRANPTVSDRIVASRGIATIKSLEGFHASALKDLEGLLPLLKHAEPLTYYEVTNSYAVELIEHNRLAEAHRASLVAVSSPFGPFYPEWQGTLLDVASKREQRSSIVFSRRDIEHDCPAELRIPNPNNPINKARVRAAIDFMSANLNRSLTLAELSAVVHLSPSYFSNLFKTETGNSPGEYLIRLRIEKATELLATGFMSVKEVMASVGYNNKSNFTRHFKRRKGLTPSEYRKRNFTRE